MLVYYSHKKWLTLCQPFTQQTYFTDVTLTVTLVEREIQRYRLIKSGVLSVGLLTPNIL